MQAKALSVPAVLLLCFPIEWFVYSMFTLYFTMIGMFVFGRGVGTR